MRRFVWGVRSAVEEDEENDDLLDDEAEEEEIEPKSCKEKTMVFLDCVPYMVFIIIATVASVVIVAVTIVLEEQAGAALAALCRTLRAASTPSASSGVFGHSPLLADVKLCPTPCPQNPALMDPEQTMEGMIFFIIEWVFIVLFTGDFVFRAWAMGTKAYFEDALCIADFIVVAVDWFIVASSGAGGDSSGGSDAAKFVKALRMVRLVRLVRLGRAAKMARMIAEANRKRVRELPWRKPKAARYVMNRKNRQVRRRTPRPRTHSAHSVHPPGCLRTMLDPSLATPCRRSTADRSGR